MVFDPTKLTLLTGTLANSRKVPKEFRQAVEEIAAPLGEVVWAWNYCHAAFHRLFAELVNQDNLSIGVSIWHAIQNDTGQRELLIRAARESLHKKPRVFARIKWAKERADKLSEKRNDAIHAATALPAYPKNASLIVDTLSTPPTRSKRLKGKEIKNLLPPLRGDLIALANYVSAVHLAWLDSKRYSLLRKPQLRTIPMSNQTSKKAHHNKSTKHQRPRRSPRG